MNRKLFRWVIRKAGVKHGQVLPKWAIVLRFIICPISSIRWSVNEGEGYQITTGTWRIEGLEFPGVFFEDIANNAPYWFKVVEINHGIVTFEYQPISRK